MRLPRSFHLGKVEIPESRKNSTQESATVCYINECFTCSLSKCYQKVCFIEVTNYKFPAYVCIVECFRKSYRWQQTRFLKTTSWLNNTVTTFNVSTNTALNRASNTFVGMPGSWEHQQSLISHHSQKPLCHISFQLFCGHFISLIYPLPFNHCISW